MPAPAARHRAARLTAQIAALGFVLPGSVADRYTSCGKTGCRCTADPPALHGPYLTGPARLRARQLPAWLRASCPDADPDEVNRCWQAFLRRFDIEHTFRFLKQVLGWTKPKLRDPPPPTGGPG